jgi:hypothetical protein
MCSFVAVNSLRTPTFFSSRSTAWNMRIAVTPWRHSGAIQYTSVMPCSVDL